ncbi:hypothetical protein AB0L13_05300 [Saccharopolyspora shandongensis]
MIKRWNPAGVAPPIGRYSHLARVPAGHEHLIISGQRTKALTTLR